MIMIMIIIKTKTITTTTNRDRAESEITAQEPQPAMETCAVDELKCEKGKSGGRQATTGALSTPPTTEDRNQPPPQNKMMQSQLHQQRDGIQADAASPLGAAAGVALGLDDLPEEVLLLVLSFLPPASLVRLSLLSLRWHALLNDASYATLLG